MEYEKYLNTKCSDNTVQPQ